MKKDLDSLVHELAALRDEKARDADEINRLRDLNNFKEHENAETAARIKSTDYQLYQAQEKAADLGKQAEARAFELSRTTEAYDCAQADLSRARGE